MNSPYKILRWDVILKGNIKIPIIYVAPDLAFLEFVRRNDYNIICSIKGTNMIYDCYLTSGIVDKSCCNNCLPDYCSNLGSYIITLTGATWNGYPNCNSLGYVSFIGLGDDSCFSNNNLSCNNYKNKESCDTYKNINSCNDRGSKCSSCKYEQKFEDSFSSPECINCKFGTM
jgi:hypothetical protein